MFPSLVLTVLLSLNVAATPVVIDSFVTLPLSRKANFTGTRTLLSRDLARARHLRARAEAKLSGRAVINEPLDNQAVGYIAAVGPPSRHGEFKHVDWIEDPLRQDVNEVCSIPLRYDTHLTRNISVSTNQTVAVTYGSGNFSHWIFAVGRCPIMFAGNESPDQASAPDGWAIPDQPTGAATRADGFNGVDGILGIGPTGLTRGTLSPATTTLIPTVTDNLFRQGTITSNLIGISFQPTTQVEVVNGEISWGKCSNPAFQNVIRSVAQRAVDEVMAQMKTVMTLAVEEAVAIISTRSEEYVQDEMETLVKMATKSAAYSGLGQLKMMQLEQRRAFNTFAPYISAPTIHEEEPPRTGR
ncbi:hypothetical protein C8J57DRAFT_1717551 [Mycena rebaudengoi]|nr:hypothetical protein C8J57DRAFT_1717551 [Mycena rebaudengoi]